MTPTADHGLDLRRPRHPRRPRGRLGPGPSGGEGPSARRRMPFVPPMRYAPAARGGAPVAAPGFREHRVKVEYQQRRVVTLDEAELRALLGGMKAQSSRKGVRDDARTI